MINALSIWPMFRDVVRVWFSNRRQAEKRQPCCSGSRNIIDHDIEDSSDEEDEDEATELYHSVPSPEAKQRSSVIVRNVSSESLDISLSSIVEQTIGTDAYYPDLLS